MRSTCLWSSVSWKSRLTILPAVRSRFAPGPDSQRQHASVRGARCRRGFLALDASRRAIAAVDADEGVSPYRRDGFEPVLRACQARLDAEGGICLIARHWRRPADAPAGEHLTVSDRWVLFARRRSDSFILADLENLKKSVEKAAEEGSLPGPAQTLVMGPSAAAERYLGSTGKSRRRDGRRDSRRPSD